MRTIATALTCALVAASAASAQSADPRLRDIVYDPGTVVTVPVKRGFVTLIVLGADESILEVGAGLAADCTKAEAPWCVAAQTGGRTLFVKPKSGAAAANTVAVVTDRRSHSLRFVVLEDADPHPPLYRLTIKAPAPPVVARPARSEPAAPLAAVPILSPAVTTTERLAELLRQQPQVVNTAYSLAEGIASGDIIPTLVFDDGRFTYLRFPGNRPIPAAFEVLGDGSETVVNTRMEGDLLVVDRVSPRLMLRSGAAVVGLWNDAYDSEGAPPIAGSTVPGIERAPRGAPHSGATR